MLSSNKFEAPAVAPEVSALIRARLDAFVSTEHDSDELSAELVAVCEEHPGASWEVLALLDQYHRRGHLSNEIFQVVKAETNKLIFGPPPADETPELRISSDRIEPDFQSRVPADKARDKPESADSTPIGTPRKDSPGERQPLRELLPPIVTPGTVLRDRYVIEAPLGRGGMSTIFKALDRHRMERPPADRHVAIKVLRDEFSANPEAVVALQDEFCLAQSLSHPNIINVFDLDHEGDRHFITMELLEGELLSEMTGLMLPRLLPLRQSLGIIREVGAALEYAHERRVVHADLKPGNIMITRMGGVRVLDFGVATRTLSDPLTASPPRRLSLQAATPAYASSERRLGLEPDPRDDIYSLACIAYELFSGQRPYDELPADLAHPKKFRLRRIRGLTRRQWRTLKQGLAPLRSRRPRTVREWLDGLELDQGAEDLLSGRAMQHGSRRPVWPSIAFGIVLITGVIWFLVITETGPFRDLPWAVAAREFAREAFAPPIDPEVAANRSAAAAGAASEIAPSEGTAPSDATAPSETTARSEAVAPLEGPALSESAVVLPSDESAAPEEPPASPGTGATATLPADAADLAPSASKATSPVARGPGVLSFTQDSYSISEGATVARLMVRREAGSDGEVGLRWRTIGSSATPGEDFVAFDGASERVQAGQQTAVLYIPVMSDAVPEHTELFYVEIDDPRGGASLGPITRATVILVDDD